MNRSIAVGFGLIFAPAVLCTLGCTNTVPPASEVEAATDTASTEAQKTPAPLVAKQDATAAKSATPGPAWENLVGTDDKEHSLSDYADAKAVAVVFTCNHCPVAKAYEERLVELADDYGDQQVQLVAINVNNVEADKLPAMKKRAEEKGFNFPYLYDPSQQIGRDYGATVTPHVFLLDGSRNIVYQGAIDDNQNPDQVSEQYLRDAIDAVLAGRTPATASTKAFGCGIQYE